MRIIWNTTENYFQAELSLNEHWADDKDQVKKAGFKTTGSPGWIWYAEKASVLNKLRKVKPKSGLVITEVALEKYKLLNDQDQKKAELKKLFEKEKQAAVNERVVRPEYEQDDFVSYVVLPTYKPFVPSYVPPEPPGLFCFICGDSIYFYEYPDICLWCDKLQKTT